MPRWRLAILDDYQGVALSMADWSYLAESLDIVVYREPFASRAELIAELSGFQIVVAMRERTPFPGSVLQELEQLRLLVTTGMRNAAIDVAAARARGIVVSGTRSFAEPTVELTWALLLALARHLVEENRSLRAGGPWQSTVGVDLWGKTLGVLGLGRIGSQVARIGLAFGMEVLSWSHNLTPLRAAEVGVRLAPDLPHLLAASDFVSIHLVLSERTRHLLGEAELSRMRRTAYLVNTSRAGIVDSRALVRALQEGWIAGAGLDVFDVEPLPAGHVLRSLPNVLATPHLGYVTERNYRQFFADVVEDVAAFLRGAPIRELA